MMVQQRLQSNINNDGNNGNGGDGNGNSNGNGNSDNATAAAQGDNFDDNNSGVLRMAIGRQQLDDDIGTTMM
jgi:hypothetical protein